MRYFRTTAILLLLSFALATHSSAQYFSNYEPNDELFTQEVKLVDEFMERFNGTPAPGAKKTYSSGEKGRVTRGMMLVSLFNLEDKSFTDKDSELKGFFRQVLDTLHPVYLSFNDGDWYADAEGVFLSNGKLVEVPLVLDVQSKGEEWSKWMIAGIGNTITSKEPKPSVAIYKANDKAPVQQYISTSAYATSFSELHQLFSAKMEEGYYFEPGLLATEKGRAFVSQIKSGQLQFQYVKTIKFQFYQLNGWIFTVQQYRRKTNNTGWLISSVKKVSETEKEAARKKLLNR